MNWVKGIALGTSLVMPASAFLATGAMAEPTKSKAEIRAFLAKCSDEADAKGLFVKSGKGAERKAYRRTCMTKFGVAPKAE